jgi:hypothetical protein
VDGKDGFHHLHEDGGSLRAHHFKCSNRLQEGFLSSILFLYVFSLSSEIEDTYSYQFVPVEPVDHAVFR